ncbi:MAG: NAD-dependent epimerase/dehydratase family protein [Saprospiraceae bacterium]|nr:NAD-dependent epimerase/dehydratase family protein [Saprospiraceae bacterium]
MVKNNRILITGSNGFVGSYIVRALLNEGYKNIFCLKREHSNTDLLNDLKHDINWVLGDILDIPFLEDVMQDTDTVIHAAAIVSHDPRIKHIMLQTAVEGTANMVNVALFRKVRKFIFISSVAALGRRKPNEIIDEEAVFSHSELDSYYGLTKFLAEQEVWRGDAEGLPVTVLSPSFILGAGKWDHSSTRLFKKAYEGLKYFPTGSAGFVDIRDVAIAVTNVVNQDFLGKQFIISSQNLSFAEVLNNICHHLDVQKPVKALTPFIARFLIILESLKSSVSGNSPFLTKDSYLTSSASVCYNNDSSVQNLKMSYRSVSETLNDCCRIFLKSRKEGKNFGVVL